MLKYTLKNPEKDLWGSLKSTGDRGITHDRSFYDMLAALSYFKAQQSKKNVEKYRTPLKQINDYAKWGWN